MLLKEVIEGKQVNKSRRLDRSLKLGARIHQVNAFGFAHSETPPHTEPPHALQTANEKLHAALHRATYSSINEWAVARAGR
ncbi:hypothetical protein VZT92_006637 [Zoarces viviparus]|uniref:Uncharacterized protein n=1 Tax=Zoarces viviparus TaxID=48416 RepID=A0AAW1FQF8_ZOAVI